MNHDHSPSAPIVLPEEAALEVANGRKALERHQALVVVGKIPVDLTENDRARFEMSVSNFLVDVGHRQAAFHQLPIQAMKSQPIMETETDNCVCTSK